MQFSAPNKEAVARLLTLKEVASHFGVSVTTVKQLGLPFTRIGRQRRYHPSVIAKYEAEKSSQPKAWREGTAA